MRRRRIQIIIFLDVFAVIAFAARQAENPLLQNLYRARSRERARYRFFDDDPGYRRYRPRSSDKRGCARGRAENNPKPRPSASSLRGRFPRLFQTNTVPSVSNVLRARAILYRRFSSAFIIAPKLQNSSACLFPRII